MILSYEISPKRILFIELEIAILEVGDGCVYIV